MIDMDTPVMKTAEMLLHNSPGPVPTRQKKLYLNRGYILQEQHRAQQRLRLKPIPRETLGM